MAGTLRVLWTICTSTSIPRPILRCSRCDMARPFESSGRFRLNANGKRLDAWLIYRCAACGNTWNRPIFERRDRAVVKSRMLEALHANDPAFAREIAEDRSGLSRWASRFEDDSADVTSIGRSIQSGSLEGAATLVIAVACSPSFATRVDRALALGFGISRSRAVDLVARSRVVDHVGAGLKPDWLLRNGSILGIELEGLSDSTMLAVRAAGE